MEYDLKSARKNIEAVKGFQEGFGSRPTDEFMRDVGYHDFVSMEISEVDEDQPEKHTVETASAVIKKWLQKTNFSKNF